MNFFYNAPIERGAPGNRMPSANRPVFSLTQNIKTLLLGVKLAAVLLLTTCLQVSAKVTNAQKLSISFHNGSLEKLFAEIEKKTPFVFFYDAAILKGTKPVTVEMREASVEEILRVSLKGQALDYSINDKTIFVKRSNLNNNNVVEGPGGENDPREIHGTVLADDGTPLSGATIKLKDGKIAAITDERGTFKIKIGSSPAIEISYTGYASKQVQISGNQLAFTVSLTRSTSKLDEVQVIAYGTTTQRLSTGNVSKVTSKEIQEQPVSNVLGALEGRVPGLLITQQTGVPGGGFTVQIRGQNSIGNGNDPFYVIDGVPYNSQIPFNESGLGVINTSLQGGSPLNFINPYDIESVEVLKDADATAIYGSRAANGAILITTRKGKVGAMRVGLNVTAGTSRPSRDIKLMNTEQYLGMRHEAFANDKRKPGGGDHDINGDWDTTRYTDWASVFLNNHPIYNDYEASVSGGTVNTQWLVGGGYNRQTTGLPTLLSGDGADERPSAHFSLSSASSDKRFKATFTGSYVSDKNTVQTQDFSQNRFLAPNAPALFNSDGTLNWAPLQPGDVGTFSNPYAYLYIKYRAVSSNLVGNGSLSYSVLPGLEIRANVGYTNTQIDQVQTYPTTIYDPGYHMTSGNSNFETSNTHGWIAEPQVNYEVHLGRGVLSALAGGTFHATRNSAQYLIANGFISDALLEDAQAASSIAVESNESQYKYSAAFGRLNYNWDDKYIVNLTARRDGSSRFGPGRQFGSFGAVGAAWIFTREKFMQNALPILSFGKIRASYGTTGNDQIGDYQFLDLYKATQYQYGNSQGLYPQNLFNPQLAWELDKKLEGGIELGFLKDRMSLGASYYRNRSNNQLVNTPVSLVTGFGSIPANFPALVQNSGMEFFLHSVNLRGENFTWSTSINLTIAKNKLLAFPNFETSGYTYNLQIGQPITVQRVYHLIGVNDTTGLYQFASSKSGSTYLPNSETDRITNVNTTPKYYGGIQNSFSYKGFTLDVLFQFVKQTGRNIFGAFGTLPGSMANMPVELSDHWRQNGDHAKYQKFGQTFGATYRAYNFAKQSDFVYSDASYIRLKTLSASWQIPAMWRKSMHLENCRFFVNAQNLFTITHYDGIDPETQSIGSPTKKVIAGGFQVMF